MVRKSIFSVMLVIMMVFAAGMASAYDIDGLTSDTDLGGYNVFVNPGNLGDTLIGGYYNVRGMANFFTIVNTSDVSGVIARIRFREATESDEVLDFNICLSKNDVFAGIIVDDSNQARIHQLDSDTTLTNPVLASGVGEDFKHNGNNGLADVTADETKEGYYEIIGLTTTVAEPTTCPKVTTSQGASNDVPNVLTGSHFMKVNGSDDTYAYRMLALADFQNVGLSTPGLTTQSSTLGANSNFTIESVNWAATKASFASEYMLFNEDDPITGEIFGSSSYIVNFFTKNQSLGKFQSSLACPFGYNDYDEERFPGVSIGVRIWDENEKEFVQTEEFSPVVSEDIELCYEVNVIELETDSILDSGVVTSISADEPLGFGWMKVDLSASQPSHATRNFYDTLTTRGLPAWVLWLQNVNGALSHAQEVAYETDITMIPMLP